MSRTLNIVTQPYTTTNKVRINIYKNTSPNVVFLTQEMQGPLPETYWTFAGLQEGSVYNVKILEVAGSSTIQQYNSWNVTVGADSIIKTKAAQQIQGGFTPGFATGTNVAVMDGTNGTDDWRGWDINFGLSGNWPAIVGDKYSWDKTNGTLTLLQAGDIFEYGVYYFTEFEPQVNTNVQITVNQELFTDEIVVTGDTTLNATDAGKKIIIQGAGTSLNITLPDVDSVLAGKPFYFESGIGNHINATIISPNVNAIDWLQGNRTNLYIGRCESLVMYRQQNASIYRVHDSDGNFKTVGEKVSEFANIDLVFNKVALDGTICNILKHARLYNDYVLRLPGTEVVSYAAWSTGDNKYKYSLANGIGDFHVPDLRDLFERNTDGSRLPGTYQDSQNKAHTHLFAGDDSVANWTQDPLLWTPIKPVGYTNKAGDLQNTNGQGHALYYTSETYIFQAGIYVKENPSSDGARPKNYTTRMYVRI